MMKIKISFIIVAFLILVGCNSTGGTRPTTTEQTSPNPKAAELNMRLGLNYMQRGDYKIALEKLDKALIQNPNLPSAHNTIAILYQRLKEMDKAEYHFKQAIAEQPDYSSAHNNYGAFLCGQKKYKEAEQQFLEAIKNPLYDSPAQAYENAGLCVNRIPDQTLAEQYFRKALQIDPNLSKSLLQMAKLRFLDIDYTEAQAYLKRYQAIAPWTAEALLTAIKIESRLGNQDTVASYKLLLRAKFPDSDEEAEIKRGQY